MGLSNSMNTGVGALKSFERGMEVVGNNIANANTTGYKSERMEYKESFFNVLNRSFSGAGNPSFGVTSTANQVGMGVTGDIISTNFSQGQIDTTNVETDLAITGQGFFKVLDTSTGTTKTQYTRAGNFTVDTSGNLITHEGKFVQGLSIGSGNLSLTATGTSDGMGTPAKGFGVNASNINTTTGEFSSTTLTLPSDFSGGTGYYSNTNGLPKVNIIGDGAGAEAVAIVDSTTGAITGVTITKAGSGYNNAVIQFENPPKSDLKYTVTSAPTLGTVGNINLSLPSLSITNPTASSALSTANVAAQAPSVHSVKVTDTGQVDLILSNGEKVTVGQVLLQNFTAPQNLTRVKGGYYENDVAANFDNTFDASDGVPGRAGLGDIRQGSLEISNADMTENFSDLILTQRSFQGAARIITTSDEIVKEAINLKR
jgi:flagellar hook protein FlgE